MPRIQVRINAQPYMIHSSNRDTIAAWLSEIVSYMPGHQADFHDIQVWPMAVPITDDNPSGLDWPSTGAMHNSYPLTTKGVRQFADDLITAMEQKGAL